jgi:hypothetical protein
MCTSEGRALYLHPGALSRLRVSPGSASTFADSSVSINSFKFYFALVAVTVLLWYWGIYLWGFHIRKIDSKCG